MGSKKKKTTSTSTQSPLSAYYYKNLYIWIFLIIVVVLLLDQTLKFWVKTTMYYGQTIPLIGDWALLHFTENEGIAFGFALQGPTAKVALSIFRILTSALLIYLLCRAYRSKRVPKGLLVGLALIIAGALGNVIDGTFYGLIFSSSQEYVLAPDGMSYILPVAQFLPEDGGYAPLFQGLVVDMFYFPIIDFIWPDWLPGLAGKRFLFFSPIFNLADAAITTGVLYILIFHWKFFYNKN